MANKLLNKIFVALYRLPWVKERWGNQFQAVKAETIPWTPLRKPLAKCKIALLTTGGVHLKSDPPFNMVDKDGDPTYRAIPANANPADLTITHDYYNHSDADEDINLVLPLDILREYQQMGVVGPSADFFYSFMGHIDGPHLPTLINQTSKAVAQALKKQGVDIALLVPA
jgi:D-proline reductase (dithiol) PrdB